MAPLWMALPLMPANYTVSSAPPIVSALPAVSFAVKLGAQLSPGLDFAGGIDMELSRIGFGRGWTTRLDADLLIESTNDGFLNNLNNTSGLTVNELRSWRQGSGRRVYAGFGAGWYNISIPTGATLFGATYEYSGRVGGKLFAGAEITSTTSLEATVHFIQGSQPLIALQARLKL